MNLTIVMLSIASLLSFFGVIYAIDFWLLILSVFIIKKKPLKTEVNNYWPKVSIHIPLYNEENVAARVLTACLNLDYPKDKMEIIVVDDSNDETTKIIRKFKEEHPDLIKIIHRSSREGFKAGALQLALKASSGEIIALFDADHVPSRSFLKKLIPYLLADENIAFIQAKFDYLNLKNSWIAKFVSIGLEFHNMINLNGRNKLNFISHFKGGGGIFKKSVLEKIGGWQSDTLAEDLDLSIRLFLAGKKGVYISETACLEEIPEKLLDLIKQQQRWIKGFVQCFKKHFFAIIKNKKLSFIKKIDALIYLSTCLAYPLGLFGLIFGFIFSQFFPQNFILINLFKNYILTFNFGASILSYSALLTGMSLTLSLNSKNINMVLKKSLYAIGLISILMPILLVTNSIAVIEGFIKKKHVFYRTKKTGKAVIINEF
jgi:cellulose synthase/poly-beta-1,6-N-acetylglucosamine synthase-like glycosyltransferase